VSFVEPFFLIGLLAAGLPLAVHLINRRKAVRRPFPAMKFLLQSNRRESTGIKVRQWLLMALRILVIALLAFALAKPFVLSSSGVTASDRLPTAIVFVVEDSYSMANGDWWEVAQDEFESRYDRLRPWDQVALVTTGPETPRPVPKLTGNHGDLEDAFEELSPGEHRTNLVDALLAASEIVGTSELPNRKIVVISDLARGGFPMQLEPDAPIEHPVEFVSVRDAEKVPNLAIDQVEYEQEGSSREPLWRIDATVRNLSDEDQKVEIRLNIAGDTVAGGLVEVPAGKSAEHTFRHRLDGTGVQEGIVELVDPDDLSVDDRRYFAVRLRDSIRTLLVNGEPSSIAFRDEMFFLERALNPRSDTRSNIVPELTTREGLVNAELGDYDVVILANVAKITPVAARKLADFVNAGGGLFITMGDQVDPAAYNQNLGDLLPKPLRGLKQLALRDDPDAPLKVTRLGGSQREHPIFQVFQLPGGSTLQSVVTYSYMLLEPSPPEQSEVILTYKDNAPALLEREVGRGRVLLWTTSIDDEWTDLPYRPAFLPLTRRSVQYLARRATSAGKERHVVGEEVELEIASVIKDRAVVTGPDDLRLVLEPTDGKIRFTPRHAGLYQVWAESDDDPDNRVDALAFTANVDTDESNLARLPDDALVPWTADGTDASDTRGTRTSEKRVNLWPGFLFCVTLFLLAETILGTRRSVLARLMRIVLRRPEPTVE
jgi:hypothetical protein